MLVMKDGDTDTLLCTDITQMLEDINSITWRNKTGNDIFEHIIKEVIVTLALEDINY